MEPKESVSKNVSDIVLQKELRESIPNEGAIAEAKQSEQDSLRDFEMYECSICASTELKSHEIGSGLTGPNSASSFSSRTQTNGKERKTPPLNQESSSLSSSSSMSSLADSSSSLLLPYTTFPYLCRTPVCHDLIVCNLCLKTHFMQIISSGYLGSCPPMRCISCQEI